MLRISLRVDRALIGVGFGRALVRDEQPAVRALEACMPWRVRLEQFRAEVLVAVRAFDVENVPLVRCLGHDSSVAVSVIRTEP
jgi:hypothetical protein